MYSDKCRTPSSEIQFDSLVQLSSSFSWKKTSDIIYILEGSHLSYPELNNFCVKEDIIIISGHISCRILIQ